MKTPDEDTGLFPAFVVAEAEQSQQKRLAARERQIAEHCASMKCCWPEWHGPVANGSGLSGFCEVHSLIAHSLTHGARRYHYTAPCRVESVSADGLTVIAVVAYPEPGPCRDFYNGERLRLDITEVWPPCRLLWAQRRAGQRDGAAVDKAAA